MINKLFNQCTLEVLKQIKSDSVDSVITDPPYLINYKTNYRKNKDHAFTKEILNDGNNSEKLIKTYIEECHRIMKPNTAMYMFCSAKTIDFFKKEVEKLFKIKNIIIWVKNNWTAGDLTGQFGQQYEMIILAVKGKPKFNGKRITDVWFFDRVAGKRQLHQNEKPIELIKQCIEKHTKKGDVVFDGFMGSGTTCIAAKEMNRNFIGVELDKTIFEIAKKRLNLENEN